ncbi:MAG: hypothetical protein ACI4DO_09165 [Roseburia sp.]
MADITRFVTYLYYYDGNQKKYNAGFAKVEVRGGQCRIELHIKASLSPGTLIPICLFTRAEDVIWAVEVGKMHAGQMSGDFKTIIKADQVGNSPYSIQDMKGIVVPVDSRQMYASQWDDEVIRRENIRFYQEPSEEETEKEKEYSSEMQGREELEKQQESQPEVERSIEQSPDIQAQELNEEEQEVSLWEAWKAMKQNRPLIHPVEGKNMTCIQMELKDFKNLPKRFRQFGNNSFLLHGFLNYRFVLFGEYDTEQGKRLMLGVPGVLQGQEKILAAIFGFPLFVTEKGNGDQFGYWCHLMDE